MNLKQKPKANSMYTCNWYFTNTLTSETSNKTSKIKTKINHTYYRCGIFNTLNIQKKIDCGKNEFDAQRIKCVYPGYYKKNYISKFNWIYTEIKRDSRTS